MFRFVKDLAWHSGKSYFANACPQLAAAITYYVVFSIFPFVIFVASVAGLFLDDQAQDNIVDEILEWFPFSEDEGRNDVEDAIDNLSGPTAQTAGIIGLVLLLWSASSMFNAVRRSLNIIFGDPEYKRPWVPQKLIDLGLVLGLGAFFAASAFTATLLTLVRQRSDDVALPGDLTGNVLWQLADVSLGVLIAFVGFTVLYIVVPSRPRRLVDVWPGALVAAVAFQAAVIGFAWYVQTFSDFSVIYGSLATVMIFLLWVFFSSQIVLAGAQVASVYPRVRSGEMSQASMEGMQTTTLPIQVKEAIIGLFVRRPPPGGGGT